MGQYCFARWRLSSVVVVRRRRLSASSVGVVCRLCNAAGGRAGRPPGARAVGWPTLHGGPVRLRLVRATPCFVRAGGFRRTWRCLICAENSRHLKSRIENWSASTPRGTKRCSRPRLCSRFCLFVCLSVTGWKSLNFCEISWSSRLLRSCECWLLLAARPMIGW